MDLYQYFTEKLHCEGSDLRIISSLVWSASLIEQIPEDRFSLAEWREFLAYLHCSSPVSSTAEAKRALLLLKCPCSVR